ncbi:chitin synthase [Malassezia psittaci]|uniref:chitin synthase n=1 Tax=Malassezia psittaci TaxID=1821823 RepID=A0AAF0F881_9BASI|nr:chitin synthase [Malassezia psittaci]
MSSFSPNRAYGAAVPPSAFANASNSNTGSAPSGLQRQSSVTFQEPVRNQAPRPVASFDSLNNKGRSEGAYATGVRHSAPGEHLSANRDPESAYGNSSQFRRKKSLVRPERERIDPSHRQWYYRNHAAQMDMNNGRSNVGYMPSATGHMPHHGAAPQHAAMSAITGPGGGVSGYGVTGPNAPAPSTYARNPGLRRGKSILGRDEDKVESGIHFLRRGVSMRNTAPGNPIQPGKSEPPKAGLFDDIAPGPVGCWMVYCWFVTICIPSPVLKVFGIKTPEQQRAWREKMGLVSIIAVLMTLVGYITFGFTETVCGTNQRYSLNYLQGDSKDVNGIVVGYGEAISMDSFNHPAVSGIADLNGTTTPIYVDRFHLSRSYINLLFPVTGGPCEGVMNTVPNADPPRYFDCSVVTAQEQHFNLDVTGHSACHNQQQYQSLFGNHTSHAPVQGTVYVPWDEVSTTDKNIMIWRGSVINLNFLNYLDPSVNAPDFFNELKNRNPDWVGQDATAKGMRGNYTKELDCLAYVAKIAYVDAASPGCMASQVELVLSMVFIVGAVAIKFLMALYFAWCVSWRLGNYDNESYAQRMQRMGAIENWTDDIYRPAPAGYRPNVKKTFLPKTSRFTAQKYQQANQQRPSAIEKKIAKAKRNAQAPLMSPPDSPMLTGGRSSASLGLSMPSSQSRRSSFSTGSGDSPWGPCPFPLDNVVPQPPADYRPFNFPLVHSICLVTAYSESFEGLRTTLDSLATTNYPNSHKLILVIADGIVKGAESDISTPDICLSMMQDLIIPAEDVEGNSYVAIADGAKRHNMAKVYAGFYDYDDQTVEKSKQQRVPMILIAKCGSMMEMDSAKPGNRGKRDSQVLLMAFMQKVLFDERMTQFEYEFFNAIWRVTGVTPEQYEIVLMVDADTKVFPDSLTRMAACMVEDPEIMGLCGETKIANKAQSWVTMIQVFEYYISHHQTKGFEACFGRVTCLPGCFSAYRFKSPKGPKGYYVPILANPDIVEHYSENVVDTLHKKNLLLLGEDRYLTTLMLKTFPRRKMMFLPSAVCKTVVPDSFKVLRSQRRRWINSTVHNLFELILVKDLCGTFCFSMRFVVFMDMVGTLVLPAAIAFTVYVVVQAILIGITNQHKAPQQQREFPTLPLILLGLILGLPGVLIVVTSRRFMYVLWMLIYLISLPIWNLVLPMYAYWHMDDFSWGATRVVQGEKKGDTHGSAEGEFDSSSIVMKRWSEYERDRRHRNGIESRDYTDRNSPETNGGTRYSSVSSEDLPAADQMGHAGAQSNAMTIVSPNEETRYPARQRLDQVPLLELPAPLGPDAQGRPRPSWPSNPQSPTSLAMVQRPSVGGTPSHPQQANPFANQRPSMPISPSTESSMQARQHLFGAGSPALRPSPSAQMGSPGAALVSPRSSAPQTYTQARPMQSQPIGSSAARVPAQRTPPPGRPTQQLAGFQPQGSRPSDAQAPSAPGDMRRVSLVDDGPVASSDGMRQVVRGSRRQSLQRSGSQGTSQHDTSLGSNPFDHSRKS